MEFARRHDTYLMTGRTSATKHRDWGGSPGDNAAIVRSGVRTSLSSHSQGPCTMGMGDFRNVFPKRSSSRMANRRWVGWQRKKVVGKVARQNRAPQPGKALRASHLQNGHSTGQIEGERGPVAERTEGNGKKRKEKTKNETIPNITMIRIKY